MTPEMLEQFQPINWFAALAALGCTLFCWMLLEMAMEAGND